MNELAWALLSCQPEDLRDPPRALRIARELNDRTGSKNSSYLDTLAAALYQVGDVSTAIVTQRRAVELAPVSSRERFRARLEEYEAAGTPSRP